MLLLVTVACLLIVLIIYLTGKYNERYWAKRGVVFYTENRTAGIHWDFMTKDLSMFEVLGRLYKKYSDEPAVGVGLLFRPAILVRDLTNVNYILQTEFESFSDGGMDTPDYDKLTKSVLFMNGKLWKLMRQNMSPLFTATKLKSMFYIMERSSRDYIELLKQPGGLDCDTFDSLAGYACASIAASVFGIGTESVFDSPFLKISRQALEPSFMVNMKFSLLVFLPKIYKALKLKLFGAFEKDFIGAISHVIRERHRDGTKRHDFVDLCVALQKNGTLRDHATNFELEPTDELLAAQAFFYFIAGVEPCATAIFNTMLELGRNPDIVQRVHAEIDANFNKLGDKLTYDSVMEMEYLEKVINESLRLYPPAGFTVRRCVKDATLPVGNIRIEKGTHIFLPLYEIQRDSKYFPDPEVFNPERFDGNITNNAYMPFSKGNRLCIGARFARLQVKTGLAYILRHYTPETTVLGPKIKYKKQPFQVTPVNVEIKLTPRTLKSE